MPIYHFHDANGVCRSGPNGTELPDDDAARGEAVRFVAEKIRDVPDDLWADREWRVEVTDEDGALLFSVVIAAVEAPRARVVKPLGATIKRLKLK